MEKIKRLAITMLVALGLCLLVFGLSYVEYKIWRAEHPQAQTWTFFIGGK